MASNYSREKNGIRFNIKGGMNLVKPTTMLGEGEYAYLQNVRRYLEYRIMGRATQGPGLVSGISGNPVSLRRMNDTTGATGAPVDGYALIIISDSGIVYVNSTEVAHGLSGNPCAISIERPNASVEPWAYIGDSAASPNVTVSDSFTCGGMIKVRSDGLSRKMGIAEPSSAPSVSTSSTTVPISDNLVVNAVPWTNFSAQNTANYGYGQITQPGTSGVAAPLIIHLAAGATSVQLTVTGTATINGSSGVAPGDLGPSSSVYPGQYTPSPTIVLGAFTDSAGNVIYNVGSTVPSVVPVGAGGTFAVPHGATQLQIGIDSDNAQFSTNSGGPYVVTGQVNISSFSAVTSTVGNITAYIWGDSPHSGAVSEYLWKNPNDGGSGIARSIGSAPVTTTNNSWQINTTPSGNNPSIAFQWDQLDSSGDVTGDIALFPTPFSQSAPNYTNWNACLVGTIFFPNGGTHVLQLTYKDQIMLGIGGGVTASYSSGSAAASYSPAGPVGQAISVAASLPLVFVSATNGSGGAQTTYLNIQVPAGGGLFQFEIDMDYWYHAGGSLVMKIDSATIPPLPQGVRTSVSYACKFRASETGAQSNPSPTSQATVTPVLNNVVTPPYSPDPQVDKVDFYRQDEGLANYTYVGTGPNSNPPTPIIDSLTDLEVASNPTMTYDDFEPFPSIDLPRAGTVNVTSGVITWVSGDLFNTRWLPGTTIEIGAPPPFGQPLVPQSAYALISRPTSTTQMAIPGVPDGEGLLYNISEPALAAQPLASIWGPTDNTIYVFGCYDPNRPGTLYYTKGNSPDSAPDTNQIEVTSPSEILMNGYIIGGIGQVFSTERAWWIYPTFTTALATVSGVKGQAFNLIESVNDRGLYIRTCLCTEAGKNGYFRAKDGIYVSPSGQGSRSITDPIYNLFPHETATGWTTPEPVTIGAYTVWPPDDTRPNAQKLSFAYGYLYYDYKDVNGNNRTLVYDAAGKGWSVDVGSPQFTCHAPAEGQANGTYVGCSDGTIRSLVGDATETATSVVMPGSVNAGDDRAFKRVGDVYVKALVADSSPVSVALYSNRYASHLSGYSPTSLTGVGTLQPYIVDFSGGQPIDVSDLGIALTWNTDSGNEIDMWQPSLLSLPESIQGQSSDWDDCGIPGNKLIRGVILELNTYNSAKTFSIQSCDTYSYYTPNECPITVSGQTKVAFSLSPFVAHMVRRISFDGVAWQAGPTDGWTCKYIADPWVEYSAMYSAWSNLGEKGAKYIRGLVLPMDTQNVTATIKVLTSDNYGSPTTFTASTPTGIKTPVAFAFNPPIIAHEVQIHIATETAGAWVEEARWDFDPYPEIIPEYTPIMEVGGDGAKLIRGINITADTANVSTAFKILFDGGQIGPTVTGTFNGKETIAFAFNPPFIAHDIQLVPQANARVWIGDSKWDMDAWPEYTALYSAWMNLETNGAKYIRGLVLPIDTNGHSAVVDIVTSDGATIALPATTTPSGVKTQVSYAFNPPFIAHEVRFVPQSAAALWAAEAKWNFDPYPELTAEYTPIMEVGGDGAKLIRGINITADTANVSTAFKVLFDGGQTGPTVTGTFNGKQTVAFSFNPPFIAHDVQIVPQASARIWVSESKWDMDPWPEYTALYSTWTNLETNGSKYIRGLVLPMDTNGQSVVVNIVTSDGATIALPATTTPSGVKTQVAFAFNPPFIAHELRFVPQAPAGLWANEAKWNFDPYPEITAEYTSIMELSGPDNKFFQGVKLVADTANVSTAFKILFDGGQVGPTITGAFNGKQTKVFSFDSTFNAHDIQLVPQAPARVWWGEVGQGASEWMYQPYPEAATSFFTEPSSFGMTGWMHLYIVDLAYICSSTVTLTVNTDQGTFTMMFPASVSQSEPSKIVMKAPPNKWKVASFALTASTPINAFKDLTQVWIGEWERSGEYHKRAMFGDSTTTEARV